MNQDYIALTEELNALREENRALKRQTLKLTREMRTTNSFLEKVTRMVEAKETLSNVLTQANARQRAYTNILLDSCPSIIWLLDGEGRFVLSTKVFLTMAGYPNFDYVINRRYDEVLRGCVEAKKLSALGAAIERVKSTRESVLLSDWLDFTGNSDPRYYSIELMCVGADAGADAGIGAGILLSLVDLTDFMHEKQRAEDANRLKSDFLAMMSHEIRTPMNAILGMSEMLNRSELNGEQKKYLSDIRSSSQSLLSIINDILDFSKIEAGKMELVDAAYNLHAMLDGLHSMFKVMLSEKGLALRFFIGEDVPDVVRGDENRLRQVLTNLLSNAYKYTPKGRVEFSVRREKDLLVFDVKDTGIGIRDEEAKRLFTPFEQLDTHKNRNVVGTGLGLAISFNLVKLMGGQLSVVSEYGEGSVFTVEIPAVPAVMQVEEEQPEEEFTALGARALIVDDLEVNLAVAEAMIGTYGIECDLADSGKKAIERCREKEYDIIFMDHMMPEMDGVEATRHIRELGGFNGRVPVIALTANALNGMEEMFLSHQFNGFLPKPMDFAALGRCLKRWLPEERIEMNPPIQ